MQRAGLVITVILAASPSQPLGAFDDLVMQSTFTGLQGSGSSAHHVGVELQSVTDMRRTGEPEFLGVTCNAFFRVLADRPPAAVVTDGLTKTLGSLGLDRREGEAPTLLVSAHLWRARAWCLPRFPQGATYRVELNLDFELRTPTGELVSHFAVLGDAQIKSPSNAAKKPWVGVYNEALRDAMEEFALSAELGAALGPEIAASFHATAYRSPPSKATRIDYSKRSGPTPLVARIKKVDLSLYDELELEDFEMRDQNFISEHPAEDVDIARGAVSDRVFERVGGLYPGLFARVSRAGQRAIGAGGNGKRLVVRGWYEDFESGEAWSRAFIGFGAGRISFEAHVSLLDGDSGHLLTEFTVDVINLGTAQGEIEDVVDQAAADIVYYLVNQTGRGYVSPVLARHETR